MKCQQNLDQPDYGANEVNEESDDLLPVQLGMMFQLEEQRISVQREQNQIALRGLEIIQAADQHQYDYAVQKLDSDNEQDKRQHRLAWLSLWIVGGGFLMLLTLVLIMAFFGNENQSKIALNILIVGGQSLGGAGFVFLVAIGVNRLIRHQIS